MELFETIDRRYSYRGTFTDTPVPRKDLEKIVQAGVHAPSACNGQVATFVIVDDPQLLQQVAAVVDRPVCQSAKAMIVCVTDPRPVYETLSFELEDCAASVENMLLAITALGYASVWTDGWLRGEGRAEKVGEFIKLPKGRQVRIILPIGVPAEDVPQAPRKPFSERVSFNTYGS